MPFDELISEAVNGDGGGNIKVVDSFRDEGILTWPKVSSGLQQAGM